MECIKKVEEFISLTLSAFDFSYAKTLEDQLSAIAAKLKAQEIARDKVMRACLCLPYVCLHLAWVANRPPP